MPDVFEFSLKMAKDSIKFDKLLAADDDDHAVRSKYEPKVKGVDASRHTNEEINSIELRKNLTDVGGRPTRGYKGSSRPLDMLSEMWSMMSKMARQKATDEWKATQAAEEEKEAQAKTANSTSVTMPLETAAGAFRAENSGEMQVDLDPLEEAMRVITGHRDNKSSNACAMPPSRAATPFPHCLALNNCGGRGMPSGSPRVMGLPTATTNC